MFIFSSETFFKQLLVLDVVTAKKCCLWRENMGFVTSQLYTKRLIEATSVAKVTHC